MESLVQDRLDSTMILQECEKRIKPQYPQARLALDNAVMYLNGQKPCLPSNVWESLPRQRMLG